MGLKPDHWIKKMALEHGMIDPFVENQVREGVISYGVSSYGYDFRISDEFKVFAGYSNNHRSKEFRHQRYARFQRRYLYHSSQLICIG